MRRWFDDLHSALRSLRSARWATLAAIVTLALGTGANTAVFAVAYGVLVRPLPFADPARLVRISTARPSDSSDLGFQLAEFTDWQERMRSVESLAAYVRADFTVRGVGEPEVLHVAEVTGDFFRVLGVAPSSGRTFVDDLASTSVVASERYARRLAATGAVIGRPVTVGSQGMVVDATLPAAAGFPDDEIDLWVPARSMPIVNVLDPTRDFRMFRFIARVLPGTSFAAVQTEGERVMHEIHPGVAGRTVAVRRLDEDIVGSARPVLLAFVLAGALLLVVACANVATLLVGRTIVRRREFAVRLAIGADRARLVRLAFAESLVIALAASLAGVWIAHLTLDALVPLLSSSLPRAGAISIDAPVLVAGFVVALVVAFASGLAPALAAARSDVAIVLRQEAGTTTGGHPMRAPLVVAQIALAVLLLTGAGLFARTVWHLWNIDIGASRDHVLTARLALTETARFDDESRERFVEDLLREVRALPGVEAAGLGSALPPRVNQVEMTIRFVDEDHGRDDTHGMNLVAVTPGYFRALGIPIRRGRDFDDVEASGEAPVAVISEMLARQIAADHDLLGTRLVIRVPTVGGKRVQPTVVGISGDVKFVGLEHPTESNAYVPWRQLPTGVSYLVIRTTRDPAALTTAVLRVVHDLDPTLPLPVTRPLGDEVALAMASRTLRFQLIAVFAGLAFIVSIGGLATSLVRSVAERQRELAIRSALGATPRDTAGLILGQGARLIAVGVALGALTAVALGRMTSSLLFGVSAYDPLTYGLVMSCVVAVGLAACYLPARLAARVDPVALLR